MIPIANRLAIIGILQHKTPIEPTVVTIDVGSGIYSGFTPSSAIVPLPVTVVSPFVGEAIYTGITPTTAIIEPYTIVFTSFQETHVGDTPWRIRYFIYDSTLTLRRTITHNLNRGAVPTNPLATTTLSTTTYVPFYVDVQVQRMTETFGAIPRDNRVNDAGSVTWLRDTIVEPGGIITFILNDRFNNIFPFNSLSSGMEIGVTIYEG